MNRINRLQIVLLLVITSALAGGITLAVMLRRKPPDATATVTVDGQQFQIQFQPDPGDGSVAPVVQGRGRGALGQSPEAYAQLTSNVVARQQVEDSTAVTTIDLKPYVNSALTDPLAISPTVTEHTLERLPAGVHTYGGIRFDVEGLVQLSGDSVAGSGKTWPDKVEKIAIGKACKKIHLFHGAFGINNPGAHETFASLDLHYADGTEQQLDLAGGVHALMCMGPAVPPMLGTLPAPQTELGWVGLSPLLEGRGTVNQALHIYRTTLDNPKPDVPITSVDYVSAKLQPAPFMVGLTIE